MSSSGAKTLVIAAAAAMFCGASVVPTSPRVPLDITPPVFDLAIGSVLGAEAGAPAEVDPGSVGLGSFRATQNILQGRLDERWIRAAGGNTAPGTLLWPVPGGNFGRGYGSGTGNYHQAVDIAAPTGTQMLASADGLVGYAGDRLRSYGNVVLLIHGGGWVTLYAHASELLVSTGELVSVGQPIARVGDTGISRGPHLHYELIFRGQVCDPTPLFRPEPRRARTSVSWTDPNHRPREVRCQSRVHHPDSQWF